MVFYYDLCVTKRVAVTVVVAAAAVVVVVVADAAVLLIGHLLLMNKVYISLASTFTILFTFL